MPIVVAVGGFAATLMLTTWHEGFWRQTPQPPSAAVLPPPPPPPQPASAPPPSVQIEALPVQPEPAAPEPVVVPQEVAAAPDADRDAPGRGRAARDARAR